MGLDITAYSKAEYLETMGVEAWEDKYWMHQEDAPFKTAHASHWEPAYADRAVPIVEDGVYKINGETFGFRAGSYSGYNHWREQLSLMVNGIMPRAIWGQPDRYRALPFFDLICFSDCEGIIGSKIARMLTVHFATYQGKADQYEDAWFREKYAAWRKAFELAADDGFVEFH